MCPAVFCAGREKVQVKLLLSFPTLYSLVVAACLSADGICKLDCSASPVPLFQEPRSVCQGCEGDYSGHDCPWEGVLLLPAHVLEGWRRYQPLDRQFGVGQPVFAETVTCGLYVVGLSLEAICCYLLPVVFL